MFIKEIFFKMFDWVKEFNLWILEKNMNQFNGEWINK